MFKCCGQHRYEMLGQHGVWSTVQYFSTQMNDLEPILTNICNKFLVSTSEYLLVRLEFVRGSCTEDEENCRLGGVCIGDRDTIHTPDSFQSIDPNRDWYGASDMLLLGKEGRHYEYLRNASIEEHEYVPKFWKKGSEYAKRELERRKKEFRQKSFARWDLASTKFLLWTSMRDESVKQRIMAREVDKREYEEGEYRRRRYSTGTPPPR